MGVGNVRDGTGGGGGKSLHQIRQRNLTVKASHTLLLLPCSGDIVNAPFWAHNLALNEAHFYCCNGQAVLTSTPVASTRTGHYCDSFSFAQNDQVVILALTGVLAVGGIIIIINDLVGNPALTDLSETYFSVVSRQMRKVPFHKLKIPLVVFQVLCNIAMVATHRTGDQFMIFL